MRRLWAVLFLFLGEDAYARAVPGEWIVKLRPGAVLSLSDQISAIYPFETNARFAKVKLHGDARILKQHPAVEYAEPNYFFYALASPDGTDLPDDAHFSRQWGLHNTGQSLGGVPGKPGADIGAARAWSIATGSRSVVVAVVDSGLDLEHPDLKENIFVNEAEIADNGIDDDANGFVDDVRGWDFTLHSGSHKDENGHGTHVAGIIGAQGNNGIGVSGVSWEVSLLPIKFLDGNGAGTLENSLKAVQYATRMGARVINCSWGGAEFSRAMLEAIQAARDQGVLFVAAAGGGGNDADLHPTYPAGYQVENVVAVAASTNRDTIAANSGYGRHTVHIAAPGHGIYSTYPGGRYASFSGSSSSAAFFSGAAALLWSAHPGLSLAEAKDRLLRSRDPIPGFERKLIMGGRLNAYHALMGIFPTGRGRKERTGESKSFCAVRTQR
jgi:large repetitive protein